jgi:uncharacterized protein with von Willebrand factor type A (vWA) domain
VTIARPGTPRALYLCALATLVSSKDQEPIMRAVFDQVFGELAELPGQRATAAVAAPAQPPARSPDDLLASAARAAQTHHADRDLFSQADGDADRTDPDAPELENRYLGSAAERLAGTDFAELTQAELQSLIVLMRQLTLAVPERRSRRQRRRPGGRHVDMRSTLRQARRTGGHAFAIIGRTATHRPRRLVVLCDISGSMSRYAQILLHFLHAVTNHRDRVHVFLFGTRLTNITRQLRYRDPEVAFQMVAHIVPDWSGGTRIGEALAAFNRFWARRVLGQGAVVLLITDGLDRDGAQGLAENMDRLHRSCRRLIWLNPLLRWSGFEPKSQGIRAMLPHVDEFRPVHNLASLRTLVDLLSRPMPSRRAGVAERMAS